jgi:FkbM family methyltransferase
MASARKLILSTAGALLSKIAENSAAQKLLFNSIRLNRSEFFRLWSSEEVRFLSYVFSKRANSRSQILQDLWVCFELNEKRGGFFVEFGATNGLTNSNTWLLETALEWKGILAEPNPFWHSQLATNRHVAIEHRCVSSKSGDVVTFIATDNSDPELSAIASFSKGDHFAGLRSQGREFDVETISLNDLLSLHQAPLEIDYLSIDTEGNELDVISELDFKKHRFCLISIEKNPVTAIRINDILESNGYVGVFPQFSQWDGWYVSKEVRARAKPEIFAPLT